MSKYRVGALVTGMVYDTFEAESEIQAKEMMRDRYGNMSISLCHNCSDRVERLSVSENINTYETEAVIVSMKK